MAEYAREQLGVEFLPWQAMVADRLLEFDADGLYCWPRSLVLVPRQSGKSTLLRAVCEWSASQGRFAMATSAKLTTVGHLMGEALRKYRDADGFVVRTLRDQPEINWPGATLSAGRWVGQAANDMLGRGFTVDTAVLDEVQDIRPEAWESLVPAMLEVPNPLTLAFGTAARGESELLNRLRDAGMAGKGVCHIEWSVPRELPIADEETWRLASPRWTPQRVRHIRHEIRVQSESYIRSEYLCQPVTGGDDPWLNLADWDAARDEGVLPPDQPQVAVVEDGKGGEGACIALAWHDGHRVRVTAYPVAGLDDAWRHAAQAVKVRCGVTLVKEPEARALSAKPVGRKETPAALAVLRRLLPDGLAWSGDALAEQMVKVRIREDAQGGLQVLSGAPSALVRCAAWAVQLVREDPEPLLV